MSCKEQQEEELEVLRSIYDGDPNYKELSDTRFQYKYGEDGSHKSFMVEVSWGDNYPDVIPTVDLHLFYNKHILDVVKDAIAAGISEQASDMIGCGMTYTLFEWVRENEGPLTELQPETAPVNQVNDVKNITAEDEVTTTTKKKEKKEVMTKAQKRRHYDRIGEGGERPRGWDWVDIVKHLSQTGGSKGDS